MKTIKQSKRVRLATKKFSEGGFWDKYGSAILTGVGTFAQDPLNPSSAGTALFTALSQHHTSKQEAQAKKEFDEQQAETFRKATLSADTAAFGQYANAGKGHRLSSWYRTGGVMPISGQDGVVQGASHEQGGVDVNGNNLEGGEAIHGDQVFNKSMSPAVIELMQRKAAIERLYMQELVKLGAAMDLLEQSKDKYQQQGNEHKGNAVKERVKMLEQEMIGIEQQIQQIFQEQQAQNPNPEGQQLNQDGVPMATPDAMQEQAPVQMRLGGKIKASTGAISAIMEISDRASDMARPTANLMLNTAALMEYRKQQLPPTLQSKAYQFNPHVDTSAAQQQIREQANVANKFIESSMPSGLARVAKGSADIRSNQMLASVRESAENTARSIRNANISNIQQTEEKNLMRREQHNLDKYNKIMTELGMKSDVLSTYSDDKKEFSAKNQLRLLDDKKLALEYAKSVDGGTADTMREIMDKASPSFIEKLAVMKENRTKSIEAKAEAARLKAQGEGDTANIEGKTIPISDVKITPVETNIIETTAASIGKDSNWFKEKYTEAKAAVKDAIAKGQNVSNIITQMVKNWGLSENEQQQIITTLLNTFNQ